jgi:hypothetical protein
MSDEAPSQAAKASLETQEKPADSAPERAKMMSDVRYFMKQPSTPWIVFDQKSKVDTTEAEASQEPVEPSNVVVAKDVEGTPQEEEDDRRGRFPSHISVPDDIPVDIDDSAKPTWRKTRIATGAGLVAVMIGIIGFCALRPSSKPANASANDGAPQLLAPVAPQPRLVLPEEHATPAPAPVKASIAAAIKPKATGSGWLAIKGSAAHHRVYLDGKMLLGTGSRSFPVGCGSHTVAIDDRAATRDIDVPCNGTFTVTK